MSIVLGDFGVQECECTVAGRFQHSDPSGNKCAVSGYRQFPKPPLTLRVDVSKYLWEAATVIPAVSTVPAQADAALPHRSERLIQESALRRQLVPCHKEEKFPKFAHRKSGPTANAAGFIQRSDSTFIIFDCGNFLRLGVRRRENQTLYISDLVDVLTCSNPAFGKLMVSIQAAILHNALQRLPLLDMKTKHTCFTWGKLGQGAIGAVYEAHIEVDMPSDSVARHPSKIIVKLAFSREHTDRLRHEYSIYHCLSHRPVRVENIPTAFGFFEDVESDAGALVLSHNGEVVAYRSDPLGSGISVSPKERWCPLRDSQVIARTNLEQNVEWNKD
ncbi:hypothetical protein EDD85DRAFT_794796 [Armillaria nabsnona]|nr:hypothetical protein EDD85DRAFT_794796 [Armillaria nabsnona]